MAEFIYKARDAEGAVKTGEISAANEDNAAELLREHDLILTRLTEKKANSFDIEEYLANLRRISMKDRVVFTRQLGTMVKSGLPIVQALHILGGQTNNKKFQTVIQDLGSSIEGGTNFSAALQRYPKLFDKVYISLVRAGEASGHLDEILDRLANQQEASFALARKVRGALMYPAFVLVAMVAAAILMMVVVIPPLKAIFEDAGAQLPLPTRVLIALSDTMLKYWWIYLFGAAGAFYGVFRFLKSKDGAAFWDRAKLRLPIFGSLFQKIYVARFARTLASLVGGGVPILNALDIVSESLGNSIYEKGLKDAAKEVEGGTPLSQPIRQNDIWPPMVAQMVSVGEETGKMDQVLFKLADFYEEEVDNVVKNLSTLMEPLLMVVMGLGVGGLLIAIMMPIYNLGSVIQ